MYEKLKGINRGGEWGVGESTASDGFPLVPYSFILSNPH